MNEQCSTCLNGPEDSPLVSTYISHKDEKRFPNGPWCKEGDFILARPNTGTRLKIHGREFRLINDDVVEAVVDDPRGISRV